MEGDIETQRQHLNHQLDQATLRLQAYEALEVEIDQAVLRTAAIAEEEGVDNSSLPYSEQLKRKELIYESQAILKVARGIPSSPERRVKQAVFLAQRLLETERQRDEIRQQHKETLQEIELSLIHI